MTELKLTWSQWLENNQFADSPINISDEQGEQRWNPTVQDREAAWILYTEIRTRITTRSLHYRSGDEETALDSLYKLFTLTRKTIEDKGPECQNFATFAVQLLNTHLRPLTAKWHKQKIAGKIQHDDDRRNFRKELYEVQQKLAKFNRLFGKIAQGGEYCDDSSDSTISNAQNEIPEQDIPFDNILFDANVPGSNDLYEAELKAISERRKDNSQVSNLAGLTCSGGGIRSATVCLGVTQSLYRYGLLKDIDYLSTVSGGGLFWLFPEFIPE